MGLNKKYRVGELIRQIDERNANGEYGLDSVRGISTDKVFIETKANMDGVKLDSYKVVHRNHFAYVSDTSRRGDKIALAYNEGNNTFLISSIYTVFCVSRLDVIIPEYLFMFFNRLEFDRLARFNSWGSARETFSWEDLCAIEMEIPSLNTQKKAVDIYRAMKDNLETYESALEDLKLTCDGFIDDLKRKYVNTKLGRYLHYSDKRNEEDLDLSHVRGLSIEKKLIPTKANMQDVGLGKYKILEPKQFAYVPVTSRNGEKITIALNDSTDRYLVSSAYEVFGVDTDMLCPEYLMMLFNRPEFDRYARFHSWGSARETFDWAEMCDVKIPLPDIKIQRAIADIYNCYIERKRIVEEFREQLKNICPLLLRGATEATD
ncbi:restriction endonuclease subunit S [Selenomonas caprae]|uniref:Restriction endonuclease subunit S n=1 Tax=Selenomonas caprae TaxID=2606905 RepID=A0A5D6WRA8_9FIRM|nr:restriction endonuclease subunit S [Selenomonas caprae]TYZ29458.1 restriction endonuclease subunit S [Selenomonas caprae]